LKRLKNISSIKYTIAVVGALGMVGQEMLRTLQNRNFPIARIVPMDTPKNSGKQIVFNGKLYPVISSEPENFIGVDIALFSAGAEASIKLAPEAVKKGVVVIDNSSAWRMDPDCPLVVPEVNPKALEKHSGIIANPNCSTIQMVVALKPLHDAARIKRIVVSTYQAVSGSGKKGVEGLRKESLAYMEKGETASEAYDCQIAFNSGCLAAIF
jgi:aspartate-semialdehyde dehydrogenase